MDGISTSRAPRNRVLARHWRARRLLLVAATAFGGPLAALSPLGANQAFACSCMAPGPVTAQLGAASVAFIGVPTSIEPARAGEFGDVATIAVTRVIKGEPEPPIEVGGIGDGAGCGVTLTIGQVYGFVPYVWNDRYTVGLCGGLVDPQDLADAADDILAAPRSTGPPVALIGARDGPASMLLVDAEAVEVGRIVGIESPQLLAACPGGTRALALYPYGAAPRVELLDLEALEPIAAWSLPAPPLGPSGEILFEVPRMVCNAAGGGGAALVRETSPDTGQVSSTKLVTIGPDGATSEPMDGAYDVVAIGKDLYILADGTILRTTDGGSGIETFATFDPGAGVDQFGLLGNDLVVLPTASRADGAVGADRMLLIPLSGDEPREVPLPGPITFPMLRYADSTHLLVWDPGTGSSYLIAADGTIAAQSPHGAITLGGKLLSPDFEQGAGARLDTGTDGAVAVLPGVTVGEAFAPLDGTVEIDPEARGAGELSAGALPTMVELDRNLPGTGLEPGGTDPAGTDPEGTDRDDESSIGLVVLIAVSAVFLLAVAYAVWLRVRRRRAGER